MSGENKWRTYRLVKVPSFISIADIQQLLDIEIPIKYWSISRSIFDWSGDLNVITITFENQPEKFQLFPEASYAKIEIDASRYGERLSSTLFLDSHFRGLTPLNEVSSPNVVEYVPFPAFRPQAYDPSIIAVTGLAGRGFASWQNTKGTMWLRDFLPRDVENVRVMIFGYSSELWKSDSTACLDDFTTNFVQELEASRKTAGIQVSYRWNLGKS